MLPKPATVSMSSRDARSYANILLFHRLFFFCSFEFIRCPVPVFVCLTAFDIYPCPLFLNLKQWRETICELSLGAVAQQVKYFYGLLVTTTLLFSLSLCCFAEIYCVDSHFKTAAINQCFNQSTWNETYSLRNFRNYGIYFIILRKNNGMPLDLFNAGFQIN